MRRRTLLAACALALPGVAPMSAAHAAVPVVRAGADAVPGSYVVTVTSGINPTLVAAAAGAVPTFTYTTALNGFAAQLSDAQVTLLQHNPAVEAIEEDQVTTSNVTENTVHTGWDTWGLDRIDQRNLPLSNTYTHNNTGSGVHVYMFDTGIRYSHIEFGGRASFTYDYSGGDGSDCNGHGTHTSGTVGGGLAGQVTGVANAVTLHSVRVLDCSGNGTVSAIIAATDFVTANHASPALASMSIGLNGRSTAWETSLNNLIASGVTTVVAAGNSNQNACNFSPSAVTAAVVVAASDSGDNKASFSNWGSCVDLYAPGVAVWSSWYTSDTALARLDGTSMATPHVSGVATLYLQSNPSATPAQVQSFLVSNATSGLIKKNHVGTPNLLLYSAGL